MRVSVRRADEPGVVAAPMGGGAGVAVAELGVPDETVHADGGPGRVADGRHLLPRAAARSAAVRRGRRRRRGRADAVPARGDEALQRAQGGASTVASARSTSRTGSRSSSARSCSRSSPSAASRSSEEALEGVLARPRREPGRDRRARDPRAPRARARGGRRLLDRRPRRAPRPARRPGGLHRPAARRRELPPDPERRRGGGDDRLRGRPPRVRVPRREPGVRPGVRRERPRLRRAACRRHGAARRQGRQAKAEMRAAGVPLVPGTDGAASLGGDPRGRRRDRLSRCCSRRPPAAAARACGSSRAATSSTTAYAAAARRGRRGVRRRLALPREGHRARRATSRSRCSATRRATC